jgi:hypothetical protein
MNNVANTILSQLGGGRFRLMTGARDFVGSNNSLAFALPQGFARDGINRVRIVLDETDTYTMQALHVNMKGARKGIASIVHETSDLYTEDLQRIFTDWTGLDTHL